MKDQTPTGLAVMIGILGGNEETVNAVKTSIGKTIENVCMHDDILIFKFTDGTKLKMWDDGQCCCEHRYMMTDDDLTYFSGAKLMGFEIKDAPDGEDNGEVHQVRFLDVTTDKGVFQMATHNEHNGYYGGFWIVARTS